MVLGECSRFRVRAMFVTHLLNSHGNNASIRRYIVVYHPF